MERLAAVAQAGPMMLAGLAGLAIATTLAASLPTAAHASELSAAYSQLLRDPDNVELNMRYARIAERQGKIRKAMAAYERVLQIDPGHREASVALGRITVSLIPVSTRGRVEAAGMNPIRASYRLASASRRTTTSPSSPNCASTTVGRSSDTTGGPY